MPDRGDGEEDGAVENTARDDWEAVRRVQEALSAPFPEDQIKWRVQRKQKGTDGNGASRGLAVAYIDARLVMDRLDCVVGPMGWSDRTEVTHLDGCVKCSLEVFIVNQWITHEDVGEGKEPKGASSDALKRAAVKFGIGRYLYNVKPQWVDLDGDRIKSRPPVVMRTQPATTAGAGNSGAKKQAPAKSKPEKKATAPETSLGNSQSTQRKEPPAARPEGYRTVAERIEDFETGLIVPAFPGQKIGRLRTYLARELQEKLGPDVDSWPDSAQKEVASLCMFYLNWLKSQRQAREAKQEQGQTQTDQTPEQEQQEQEESLVPI